MDQDFLHRAICRWMPDLWQDLTTFLASRKLLGTLSGSQSMQRPSSFWPLLEIHTDEYIRCTQSLASWHTPWLLFLYSFAPKWGEELREGMGWFQVKTLALWDLDDLWTIWMFRKVPVLEDWSNVASDIESECEARRWPKIKWRDPESFLPPDTACKMLVVVEPTIRNYCKERVTELLKWRRHTAIGWSLCQLH